LSRLRHLILRALAMPAPWPNFGWLARRLAAQADLSGTVRTEERLWLDGRRKAAVRFALGKALVHPSMAPWDHREPALTKKVLRLAKRGLRPLLQLTALKNGYWSARKTLGFPVRHNAE